MSAENLPDLPEWRRLADPHCFDCGGHGAVSTSDPIYDGWRWCRCSVVNKNRTWGVSPTGQCSQQLRPELQPRDEGGEKDD
jgi:hypothetical protein